MTNSRSEIDKLAHKIGVKLFVRLTLIILVGATAFVLPFILYLLIKSYWIFVLHPVLLILWWKFANKPVDLNAFCPECGSDLEIIEEEKGFSKGTQYLVCPNCGIKAPTGFSQDGTHA